MSKPLPAEMALQGVIQDLQQLRGHVVLRKDPLPGGGVQLLCRVGQDGTTNWALLAYCGLLEMGRSTHPGVHLTFGHQFVLKPKGRLQPDILTGGVICVWGGLPAFTLLRRIIQTAEKASVPVERTVFVEQGQFYKVNDKGAGVYHQTGSSTPDMPTFPQGSVRL